MKYSIKAKALVFTLMFVVGIQGILLGQEEKQSNGIIQIPCNEASYDGDDYYRGMGIGVALDGFESMNEARDWAVRVVLFRAFSGFYDAVEKSLGECVCIDTCRLPDGNYQTIVVYDVPKETLMLHMGEAMVNAQFMINRYYREQYRKHHEHEIDEIKFDERKFRESAFKIFEKEGLHEKAKEDKSEDKREKNAENN